MYKTNIKKYFATFIILLYNKSQFMGDDLWIISLKLNCDSGVIITKDGASFRVEKGPDGDIWFNSSNCNIELPISFYSRNQDE